MYDTRPPPAQLYEPFGTAVNSHAELLHVLEYVRAVAPVRSATREAPAPPLLDAFIEPTSAALMLLTSAGVRSDSPPPLPPPPQANKDRTGPTNRNFNDLFMSISGTRRASARENTSFGPTLWNNYGCLSRVVVTGIRAYGRPGNAKARCDIA